jgi:DNA polymerase-3 subunit gamma/tau
MPAALLPEDHSDPHTTASGRQHEYVVVARRYRPQSFDELIGQKTVSQGLANAINTNRVGHAYLFTGARGVGKTSTARIFAKALNCVHGPTTSPCGECDICQGIASGEDVDVLEIDGASNRGIDEIRQLRQNVNIRPSRARFKIYIIDEVHMLTTPAFNALLKTLEEPPEHVKFIFCTTEAEKIPITVLSRCQRFDFAPMELSSIVERLEHICRNEGIEAEPEALHIIARRAAGSMRDSQSLLEQLLSFGSDKITAADVHAMLGTAQGGRLKSLAEKLIARDSAAALAELDQGVNDGVDVGQLAEQLLGFYRDMAAATVGCGPDLLLHAPAADHAWLAQAGRTMALETILAAVQILDQAVVRMKQSTQVRTLVEIALIRICRLEDLEQLSSLAAQLRSGTGSLPRTASPAPAARTPEPPPTRSHVDAQKKNEVAAPISDSSPTKSAEGPPLDLPSARNAWTQALATLADSGDMAADLGKLAADVAISGPNTLAVLFPAQYTYQRSACERPDRKARLEEAVSAAAGRAVRLEFRAGGEAPRREADRPASVAPTLVQKAQRRREMERHPLVRQAMELFDAEVEHVSEPTRVEEPAAAVREEEG